MLYKQIANLTVNIAQQMRGNVNTAIIEQYLKGPESPIKLEEESMRII